MKQLVQYAIYLFYTKVTKLLNSVVNKNAYKNINDHANSDLEETGKKALLLHLKKYHQSRPLGPTKSVCYAPSRSIYFGFGGNVVPCCFNRDYIYGNYPQQTVEAIINGDKRQRLQAILNCQDFSKGCRHCRSQIIAGNYEGVEARLYDKLKKNSGFPSEMIFEIDNTCNLECCMCDGKFSTSILKNREFLPTTPSPYGPEFFEQIKPFLKKLHVAKFLGGEPFLIKGYYKIWEELIKYNPDCFINLQTNGTIYNQKIEDLLKRGRFQIGVSIDSLNHTRFGEIRKNADLNQVLEHLEKFIKFTRKSGSFVNISVCPMQQNWDEIPDLVNFCNKKNVFIYFNTVYNEGFCLQELGASKMKEIITRYKNAEIIGNSYISIRNKRFFSDLIHQIEAWHRIKNDLEQSFIPRWEYSQESLLLIIKTLLTDDYPIYESRIKTAIEDLPEEMILNDHQKKMLEEMSKENLIQSLQNESTIMLKQRMANFIKNSNFDLE